jgi:hypothetical protein
MLGAGVAPSLVKLPVLRPVEPPLNGVAVNCDIAHGAEAHGDARVGSGDGRLAADRDGKEVRQPWHLVVVGQAGIEAAELAPIGVLTVGAKPTRGVHQPYAKQ